MNKEQINYYIDNFESIKWEKNQLKSFINNLETRDLDELDELTKVKVENFLVWANQQRQKANINNAEVKKEEVPELAKQVSESIELETRDTVIRANQKTYKSSNFKVGLKYLGSIVIFLVILLAVYYIAIKTTSNLYQQMSAALSFSKIVMIISIVLSLILISKFINADFDDSRAPGKIRVILNAISAILLSNLISSFIVGFTIGLFGVDKLAIWQSIVMSIFQYFVTAIVILLLTIILNKGYHTSKGSAFSVIVMMVILYLANVMFSFVSGKVNLSWSELYVSLVITLPAILAGLAITNSNGQKTGNIRAIIGFVITIIIYFVIIGVSTSVVKEAVEREKNKTACTYQGCVWVDNKCDCK